MTQRDDMVFTPDIGATDKASARVRGVEERRLFNAKKKGGLIHRMRQLKRLRQLRKRRAGRPGRSSNTAARLAARGTGSAARGAARGLVTRSLFTPIGAIVAFAAVVGLVALRLGTGMPIEGMGEQINRMILGNADDEARAWNTTKQQLRSNPHITSLLGREYATAMKAGLAAPAFNSQIRVIADEFQRQNVRDEKGRTLLREMFPVNNTLDILILRARDAIVAAWNANGGQAAAQKLANRLGSYVSGTPDADTGDAKTGGR
jgi:hypothetical protein